MERQIAQVLKGANHILSTCDTIGQNVTTTQASNTPYYWFMLLYPVCMISFTALHLIQSQIQHVARLWGAVNVYGGLCGTTQHVDGHREMHYIVFTGLLMSTCSLNQRTGSNSAFTLRCAIQCCISQVLLTKLWTWEICAGQTPSILRIVVSTALPVWIVIGWLNLAVLSFRVTVLWLYIIYGLHNHDTFDSRVTLARHQMLEQCHMMKFLNGTISPCISCFAVVCVFGFGYA